MTVRRFTLSLLGFGVFFAGGIAAVGDEVKSPDGAIVVTVELQDGKPTYAVTLKGKTVLEPSPLGLETSIGSFASDLRSDGSERKAIDQHYALPHGKTRDVHYRANELTCRYGNAAKDTLDVVFRVSDRDVAIGYRLTSKDKRRATILSEKTGFKFPRTTTAFLSQQVAWGNGYMKTKPSYEEGYMMDVPVGTPSKPKLGFTFPALFRFESDGWALVSETGVGGHYAGTRLGESTSDGLYPIAFPEKAENAGLGEATVSGSLPLQTSWKTITVGSTLGPIVESTVATDVVEPKYAPSQDYKPGRATWSWLLWQDNSMNVRDQTTFIDLAAAMGYEYVLVDAFWDANIGRDRMGEMVAYAKSKNVGVLLWYNSNGYWNDAPQTPRDCMDSAPARQREMTWMKSVGVKGMKVDFFGGDKQTTMKLYEDILTDANAYGLMCNFHGATLPRGWERMYPNYMTSEAVTASENLVFSQGFADQEAVNSTIFPFVRNPAGPMDFGPVVFNKRFSRDDKRGTVRKTTDAFQVATSVLYQSPLQHFGLTPDNLQEQPAHVIDFMKRVPAAWDETRFVDGYPGRFAAVARRSGERWYVAATHSATERREYSLALPWLKGKTLSVIEDKPDRTAALRHVTIGEDGTATVALEGRGGVVLYQE